MDPSTLPISVELLKDYEELAMDGLVPSLGESVTLVENGNSIEVHNSRGKIAVILEAGCDLVRNFEHTEARITRIQPTGNKIRIELKNSFKG